MRRYLSTLLGLTLAAPPLTAQGLRDKISQLFIFADGKDPLFLGGTAGSDSATALHADHFVPSAVNDNGTLISFIGSAVSQNVANLPVSATSGGSTFRFEGGVPVATSRSPGSVFGERAQTLGRGRVFVGANVPIRGRIRYRHLGLRRPCQSQRRPVGPAHGRGPGGHPLPYGERGRSAAIRALRGPRLGHPVGAIRSVLAARQHRVPVPER